MNKRTVLIVAGLVVLVGGWYLFRPERLYVNQQVSEALPTTEASGATGPKTLAEGSFHGVAHETQGKATILELAGGQRVLRLSGFQTSNGPDVQVYLVAAADASDNDTVTKSGFIHLGTLKGNIGDQNYDVPANADLNKYRAVTIWCRRFGVNFGTAPLTGASSEPRVLAQGSFHGVAHETKGTAAIYQLPDGKQLLRFTGFETSNGPDVQVYLVATPDAADNETVTKAGFLHVAALKGNVGDQNYELAANVDLNKYQSVTIWCRRFGVNFGTAPLMRQ